MIVPMKKLTVVVVESYRDRELSRLKRLGVLHPVVENRSSETTEKLHSEQDALRRALSEIPPESEVEPNAVPNGVDEVRSRAARVATEVAALVERRRAADDETERLAREYSRVEPWGEFDPKDIASLGEKGYPVHLFVMGAREFRSGAPENVIVVDRGKRSVRFALAGSAGGELEEAAVALADRPDVQLFTPPKHSLAELGARLQELSAETESVSREIAAMAVDRDLLQAGIEALDALLEHEHVRLGMDSAERVSYITGFIPEPSLDKVRTTATNNGWALLIRDPEPKDEVPTRIRNPRWIRTIKPVFDMLGVIPGYRERDISLWFLLFFTIFVGMIIGDAGYGALLLIASIVGIISGKKKNGRVGDGTILLTVLSLSTLAWGAMTANWFGYEPIGQLPVFSWAIVDSVSSFNPESTQAVQAVCFYLAITHLSIARIWSFIREVREKPMIKAIAQLGWLSVLLGLFFLVRSLFIGSAMPDYALYMIIGGMGAVLIFSGQSAGMNFFRGIGRGLSNFITIVFDGIGAFSDIISYIRLFAVGLASVAIAQAFNEMAAGVATGAVGYVLAALILAFGHTLNLVMGALGVVVHGTRLNLLEFSGQAGMEWTGVPYRPFAEKEIT